MKDTRWIDIEKDDEPIGFLMIGTGENCHPDADYYIADAYIKPEYRRRGYMSGVLREVIDKHPGIYCLLILNENSIGKIFWYTFFRREGFKPHYLSDVGTGDELCTQYGWAK